MPFFSSSLQDRAGMSKLISNKVASLGGGRGHVAWGQRVCRFSCKVQNIVSDG